MDAVPETFVDAFGEISFKHGMMRLELLSLSGPEPRVTQRLITSLPAFQQMLQAQNGMLEQLEKAGVIRPSQPSEQPLAADPASTSGGAAAPRLALVEVPQAEAAIQRPNEAATQAVVEPRPLRSPNFSEA